MCIRDRVYTCQEAFELLEDYLDKELSCEDLDKLKMHLERCEGCAEAYRLEASILESVKNKVCDCCLPNDLAQRINKAIDEAAE